MKKVLFALEVFIIIALFISYPILELGRGSDKFPTHVFHPVVTVKKIKTTLRESISVNEQAAFPLPVKLVAAFLKFPL